MNRCPACGTQYSDDARFCTKDGSKLIPTTAAHASVGGATPPAPIPPAAARGTAAGRAEPPQPASPMNLVDQVLDGRYHIVRKVGEGGMSFVYLATDTATKERYAIKVLSQALSNDQNAMQRLKREAKIG